ncbi:MAG: hypothetical protein JWQ21_2961 [Herminiimonas sp.]|nr:hypothetical protein [Herminiimonas sp.]
MFCDKRLDFTHLYFLFNDGEEMQEMRLKKILVAVRAGSHATLGQVLENDFALILCDSAVCAHKAINDGVDLIICGINFDESRIFDLLQYAKEHSKTKAIPFVGIKVVEEVLHKSSVPIMKMGIQCLGAEFFDFFNWTQELGKEQASEKLKNELHRMLS